MLSLHSDLLKYIYRYFDECDKVMFSVVCRKTREMFPFKPMFLLTRASLNGHLGVLKWLCSRQHWSSSECETVALNALQGGHLEVLRWLHFQFPIYGWCEWNCAWAARHGRLEILRWLRSPNFHKDKPCPWDHWACTLAAQNGHLEVLKWLRSSTIHPEGPAPLERMACQRALENKHYEVLKWLRSQTPPCPWDERTRDEALRLGFK